MLLNRGGEGEEQEQDVEDVQNEVEGEDESEGEDSGEEEEDQSREDYYRDPQFLRFLGLEGFSVTQIPQQKNTETKNEEKGHDESDPTPEKSLHSQEEEFLDGEDFVEALGQQAQQELRFGHQKKSSSKCGQNYKIEISLPKKGKKFEQIRQKVLKFAKEITLLVDWIHRQGYIHRDLKLDNIMVFPSTNSAPGSSEHQNFLKLVDFENCIKNSKTEISKEQEYNFPPWAIGSVYYKPPDLSKEYSFEWDVYSLGVTLFYWFEGTHPLKGTITQESGYEAIVQAHFDLISKNEKIELFGKNFEFDLLEKTHPDWLALKQWEVLVRRCLAGFEGRLKSDDLLDLMKELGLV